MSRSQRPRTTFCWLPPESVRTGSSIPRVLMRRVATAASATARRDAGPQESPAARVRRRAQADVVADGGGEDEAEGAPILGHEAQAGGDGARDVVHAAPSLVRAHLDRARVAPVGAEDRAQGARAPDPIEAGQAHDLARADVQVDRVQPSLPREIAYAQPRLRARGRRAGLEVRGQLAPRHRGDERLLAQGGHGRGRDHAAVAEDGDAVRDRAQLLQTVRDVHERGAARAQAAQAGQRAPPPRPGTRTRWARPG